MRSRLTTRLTAPIVAVSLLLLAVGGGAAWRVHQLQQKNSAVLAQNVASVRAAKELELGLREVRTRLNRYAAAADDSDHLKKVPELRRETDNWLKETERTSSTVREQEWMHRVRTGYDDFYRAVDRLMKKPAADLEDDPGLAEIDRILNDEILPPAHDYLKLNEALLQQASESNQRASDQLVLGLLLLAAGGAGGGVILGWFLALKVQRLIVRVQVRLRDAAGRLSEAGDAVRIEGDDLGDLDAAADRLVGPINDLIERLQRSRQEVLHAEQLAKVGQMAAGIAHEVRNPLMAIKLLVQAAIDRGIDAPESGGPDAALRGRDLEVLDEEVGRLERLTRTFLDFARPPRPQKRPVDVGEVVARTLELISPRAVLHGVAIRHSFTAPIRIGLQPPATMIAGDAGQLHQVLYNLLVNALDVAPVGSEIVVRLFIEGDDPGALVINVEDAGPGLPRDLGERIFEPFVSTKETGMGLGLSICRRVVESHGGTICARDRVGGGATFTVTLPLPPAGDTLIPNDEAEACRN